MILSRLHSFKVFRNTAVAVVLVMLAFRSESAEPKVSLPGYRGPASIRVESPTKFSSRVRLIRAGDQGVVSIETELPISGRDAWPVLDVEVRDAAGKAISVRRGGTEWHKLRWVAPPGSDEFLVRAIAPPDGQPVRIPERERVIVDGQTGLRLTIAKWHDGRKAALSLRFDDSHPTHLTKVIPLLRERGLRGTFMINPGENEPGSRRRSGFQERRADWAAVAAKGDQEFANHTAHHRGAAGDADMEAEIGDAARAIWKLFPGKSRLTALNLGGGTQWETTRTLRYFLDKYHQFDALGNSTGMDDVYGNRVANFQRMLRQHIERGLWYRVHYHYIGPGLSTSEANFRAVLNVVDEHKDEIWVAGMADIQKYQTEREAARLTLVDVTANRLRFDLSCRTDSALYDQPLTIEAVAPGEWKNDRVTAQSGAGEVVPPRSVMVNGQRLLRFEVAPRNARIVLQRMRQTGKAQ